MYVIYMYSGQLMVAIQKCVTTAFKPYDIKGLKHGKPVPGQLKQQLSQAHMQPFTALIWRVQILKQEEESLRLNTFGYLWMPQVSQRNA